jgi:hypothetical protein
MVATALAERSSASARSPSFSRSLPGVEILQRRIGIAEPLRDCLPEKTFVERLYDGENLGAGLQDRVTYLHNHGEGRQITLPILIGWVAEKLLYVFYELIDVVYRPEGVAYRF